MEIDKIYNMDGLEIDKIYNIDCLEGMKHIPDGSIDAIICDLPYGTTACAWDSVIPFDKLWDQYKRIAKPNAPIVLFGSEPFSSYLRLSNIEWYKYDWIWIKERGTGFARANNQPMRRNENVSVFYNKQPFYDWKGDKLEKPYTHALPISKSDSDCVGNSNLKDGKRVYQQYEYAHKDNILEFARDMNDSFHPTQKPVDLLRYLIRTYSNEGDTILDNCMGSGTTAVACIKEKRHFIGFELNKQYFDKACQRIDAERRQLSLF